ncbi:hypothetical protein TNIN_96421 [Trichonephila inaurata madagascariensis]|uniref:Uncharacterized protein n=1 Tax=Trichonephila inaurata madagascariensis TaxID=2747483 RepID=A0A8X6YCL5_9ARAC|nr:hypothetical protein TNIN_96421 [Trichonephila inaurata madagascariensis]
MKERKCGAALEDQMRTTGEEIGEGGWREREKKRRSKRMLWDEGFFIQLCSLIFRALPPPPFPPPPDPPKSSMTLFHLLSSRVYHWGLLKI